MCAHTHYHDNQRLVNNYFGKKYFLKKNRGATTSSGGKYRGVLNTSLQADVHIHSEHYASLFLYIYTVNFKCSSTAARRQAEDVKHDTFASGD